MPKLSFDNAKFRNLMETYSKIREKTIPDSVRLHARLLCVELAMRTQPFGDDKKGNLVGEKAITKDLVGKAMQRAGLFGICTGNEKIYNTGNVRLYVWKGHAYGLDWTHYKPNATMEEMSAFHKQHFVNGKVSSAGSRTIDVGRWKGVEKMYVKKETLDRYKDEVFKKVGIAKSGWANCAAQIQQVISGSMTRGIPAWVTRHNKSNGDVTDNSADPNNPTIILKNTTPWASNVCDTTQIIIALNSVKMKCVKQLERILKHQKLDLKET
jgi:hypothetical protein